MQVWDTDSREHGLHIGELPDSAEQTLIGALEGIVSAGELGDGFSMAGSQASAAEYVALQNEESNITRELSVARHRLNQITAVRDTVTDYKGSLSDQAKRLGISRWLRTLPNDGTRYPVCNGSMDSSHNELDQLCDALSVIEDETHTVSKAPPVLDRDLVDVTEKLQLLEDQLKAVRIRKRAIEERSKTIRDHELATARVARFLGRVEEALKLFSARTEPNGLDDEIDKLSTRISEIYGELSEAEYARKLQSAVGRVSRNLTKLAAKLDVERKDAPARLDIKELTVGVMDYAGREDFLWQLGSGANWLSYHVAAILALQAFFLNRSQSPVPALVIFDQPSQVYFPRLLARRERDTDEILDEDVQSIRGFFDAMGKLATHFKGKIQIIVLDHAGPDVWGNLDGVELAEEWRGENYLVPPTWFDLPE
jgi:predicted  nucleic acid-binding Zn-ribbon protein